MRSRFLTCIILALFCISLGLSSGNVSKRDENQRLYEQQHQQGASSVLGMNGTLPNDEPCLYPSWPHLLEPVTGNMNIVVLKVDFPDESPATPQATLQALFNGASNSLKDFYSKNSYGTFTVSSSVLPNSESWYTLPNVESYYVGNAFQLIQDAVDVFDPYVNFYSYSKIIVIHDGQDRSISGSDGIWPSGFLPNDNYYTPISTNEKDFYGGYCQVSEETPLGGVCHEFGHCLGLPDEYDTVGSNHYCDKWSLMDSGSWNYVSGDAGTSPAELMAYDRIKLGWIPAANIMTLPLTTNLLRWAYVYPLETSATNCQVIKVVVDADHYYLIEYRKQVEYDLALPDQGILVSEIDETLDTGHGIVNLMDAYAGGDKNDAEYKESAGYADFSRFYDLTDQIVMIVEKAASSFTNYRIMVYRTSSSWTFTSTTIGANGDFIGTVAVTKGQIITWDFVRVSGSLGMDTGVIYQGDSVWQYSKIDCRQDATSFHATKNGTIELRVHNRSYIEGLTIDYVVKTWTAQDPVIISEIKPTCYPNASFTYTGTFQNQGGSLFEGLNVTAMVPAGVMMTGLTWRYTPYLQYYQSITFSWTLTSTTAGAKTITFTIASSNAYTHYLQTTITVSTDSAPPVFGTDLSDATAMTGDGFTFRITATDNAAMGPVSLVYWYGSGSPITVPFSSTYTITMDGYSLPSLHYYFIASDINGNSAVTTTKTILVSDNDAPSFGTDLSSVLASTGDAFTFQTSVVDNIAVDHVFVVYWYGSGSRTTLQLAGSAVITITSNSVATLHYYFNATDAASNWAITTVKDVTITDNDGPSFGPDMSDAGATATKQYTFKIAAFDNIDIDHVVLVYWFGQDVATTVTFSGQQSITISKPANVELHYYFNATDSSGNSFATQVKTIRIGENYEPLTIGLVIGAIGAGLALVAFVGYKKKGKSHSTRPKRSKAASDLLPPPQEGEVKLAHDVRETTRDVREPRPVELEKDDPVIIDLESIPAKYTSDQIYQHVMKLEAFLRSNKGSEEPFKLAQDLGFMTNSQVFYDFVTKLNRPDLIRFDEGLIITALDMDPGQIVDLIQEFGRYLKNIAS